MHWVLGIAIGCYLIGSLPFPIIVSRLVLGIDLREHGSGNMGARNAGRVLGKRWFPVVFGLDVAKGATAAWVAGALLPGLSGLEPTLAIAIGAWMAVVGHCFPVFAGFRGGVGLAATAGGLLVLSQPLLWTAGTVILAFWLVTRNMHVGVAFTALIFPLLGWYWVRLPLALGPLLLWGLMVFYLHRTDLRKWVDGRRAR